MPDVIKTVFMIAPFSGRNFSLALNENLSGPKVVQFTHRSSKHSVYSLIKPAGPNLT